MFQPTKESRDRASRVVNGAGYAMGGKLGPAGSDIESDVKMIKSGISQHENQEHGGKHSRIKLRDGGFAGGGMAPGRSDQKPRSGKKHQGPQINVVVAGHPPAAAAPPMMPPPRPAPVMMPPKPPAGPPPGPPGPPGPGGPPGGLGAGPGMMPPGAPPPGAMPPRPMGIKTGGNVGRGGAGSPEMTAGSGSGEGRLEKAHRQGFAAPRRD